MKYIQEYIIRGSEIGPDYRLKNHHICTLFQNTIACQFADKKLAAYDLHEHNKTWVLTNMFVDYIGLMPLWRTNVMVEVWTRSLSKIRVFNDFFIRDSQGSTIARGTSSWIIIDKSSRRPVNLMNICDCLKVTKEEALTGFNFSKYQTPDEKDFFELTHKIRSSDIDFNNHVNNIVYIELAIESIPIEIRQNKQLKSIEVRFVKEIFYKDKIKCVTVQNGGLFYHTQYNHQNEIICNLITNWE